MHSFREVLLEVWREAARHIEISESANNVAALLAKHLPLACLLIRRFDMQHAVVETIALGSPADALPFFTTLRTTATPGKFKSLLAWASHGQTLKGERAKRAGHAALLVPPEIEGEVLAGP